MSVILKYLIREKDRDSEGLELFERKREFRDLTEMTEFIAKLEEPSRLIEFFTEASQADIDLVTQGIEAVKKEARRQQYLILKQEFDP